MRAAHLDINIANSYFYLAKYDMAIESYQKALPVFEQYKYTRELQQYIMEWPQFIALRQIYDKALENHFKKLEISKQMGDQREVGNTLNNIGTVYSKIALIPLPCYLVLNIRILSLLKNPINILICLPELLIISSNHWKSVNRLMTARDWPKPLNNIGNSYLYAGRLDMARDYFERSLTISEEYK